VSLTPPSHSSEKPALYSLSNRLTAVLRFDSARYLILYHRAGVKIGKACTIGAGSIVTRDIPDFSVAVGSPAKVVKTLQGEERGSWQ
jgi:hypothetical protein